MKTKLIITVLILTLSAAPLSFDKIDAAGAASGSMEGALSGADAIESLKSSGEYASLAEAFAKAQYSIAQTRDPDSKKFAISNTDHEFAAEIDNAAVKIGDNAADSWQVDWKLKSFGYGEHQHELPPGHANVKGNRMEIQRSATFTEWFENTEKGLEQGFIISEKPSGGSSGKDLKLKFAIGGGLSAKAEPDGQAIALLDKQGNQVMRYEKLKAWDARGEILAAQMSTDGAAVALTVDDFSAIYPITIDPTFARSRF